LLIFFFEFNKLHRESYFVRDVFDELPPVVPPVVDKPLKFQLVTLDGVVPDVKDVHGIIPRNAHDHGISVAILHTSKNVGTVRTPLHRFVVLCGSVGVFLRHPNSLGASRNQIIDGENV
jgi:hypothetical protein